MHPQLSVVLVLASYLLLGGCADAIPENPIEVVDYGIYNSNRTAPEVVTITDRVPATVGSVFGIRVLAVGGQAGDYEYRWTFPEMRNPADGQVWTEMTGAKKVASDEPQAFLVRINNDWEAVAGAWTIRVSSAGDVVAERSFEVFDPGYTFQ